MIAFSGVCDSRYNLDMGQPAEWRFYEEVLRPKKTKSQDESEEQEFTKELVLKTTIGKTVGELFDEVKETLMSPEYSLHCFIQKWQHIQLKNLQENRY